MKNMFFALALICAIAPVKAEVAIETVKAGAVCVVDKVGCAICPEKEEVRCNICGKPKSHETDVDVDAQDEENGDEVKCGCGKPKPGKSAE